MVKFWNFISFILEKKSKGKSGLPWGDVGSRQQGQRNPRIFAWRQMKYKGRCDRHVDAQRTGAWYRPFSLLSSPPTDVRTYHWVRLGRATRFPLSLSAKLENRERSRTSDTTTHSLDLQPLVFLKITKQPLPLLTFSPRVSQNYETATAYVEPPIRGMMAHT